MSYPEWIDGFDPAPMRRRLADLERQSCEARASGTDLPEEHFQMMSIARNVLRLVARAEWLRHEAEEKDSANG